MAGGTNIRQQTYADVRFEYLLDRAPNVAGIQIAPLIVRLVDNVAGSNVFL